MATPHTGSFRPVHYEIVMKHIGMSEHLIASDNQIDIAEEEDNSSEWARRLLHHCDTISNMKNVNIFAELEEGMASFFDFLKNGTNKNLVELNLGSIVDLINTNQALLYYWAMWESARYCILSRLRTPFGGPQQVSPLFYCLDKC